VAATGLHLRPISGVWLRSQIIWKRLPGGGGGRGRAAVGRLSVGKAAACFSWPANSSSPAGDPNLAADVSAAMAYDSIQETLVGLRAGISTNGDPGSDET